MRRYVQLKRGIDGDFTGVGAVFTSLEIPEEKCRERNVIPAPAFMSDQALLMSELHHGKWVPRRHVPAPPPENGNPEPSPPKQEEPCRVLDRGIGWSGHAYGIAGYAKMNCEYMFRVSNTIPIQYVPESFHPLGEGELRDIEAKVRFLEHNRVPGDSLLVRGYTPNLSIGAAKFNRRILYTMMETQGLHEDFRNQVNAFYEECWVPTRWNKDVFLEGGVRIPIKVMPLGVNPHIHRLRPKPEREFTATLLTTDRALAREVPKGFIFISSGLPTGRKGWDILVKAFDKAFPNGGDACLVLFSSLVPHDAKERHFVNVTDWVGRKTKARIYQLTGAFSERDLSYWYNSAHVYVSVSLGEGWNLPLSEASACGLPVIAGRNTSHLDFLTDSNSFLVDPEGIKEMPHFNLLSPWYDKQKFTHFGDRSIDQLADLLRYVKNHYAKAKSRGAKLSKAMREKYTWDKGAARIVERLVHLMR